MSLASITMYSCSEIPTFFNIMFSVMCPLVNVVYLPSWLVPLFRSKEVYLQNLYINESCCLVVPPENAAFRMPTMSPLVSSPDPTFRLTERKRVCLMLRGGYLSCISVTVATAVIPVTVVTSVTSYSDKTKCMTTTFLEMYTESQLSEEYNVVTLQI